MTKITVTINCCLCSTETNHEIDMPTGWAHRYSGIDDEQNGFCPEHAPIAEFADSQCAGCVGGWCDCPMWSAFAYSGRRRDVTEEDLSSIRAGICPRRVNGTFGCNAGKITEINLSEQAKSGGIAFANAIEEYCRKYP